MAGLQPHLVQLHAHDPGWSSQFAAEAQSLRAALGPLLIGIEHIGSTAVPDLAAKPIIDVAVCTPAPMALGPLTAALEALGYVAKGEFGLPGRQFFTRGDPVLFHLHVVEPGSPHWPRWLVFRDALRADAGLRAAYGQLKRELAARHGGNRPAYTAAKTSFIDQACTRRSGPGHA